MKKIIALCAVFAFIAGAASAAIVINVNQLNRVQVCFEETTPCTTGADCTLMVTATGTTSGDGGFSAGVTKQFLSTDAATWAGNNTQASNLYRKARKALRKAALNEDTE